MLLGQFVVIAEVADELVDLQDGDALARFALQSVVGLHYDLEQLHGAVQQLELAVSQLLVALSFQLGQSHLEKLLFAEAMRRLQQDEHVIGLAPRGHVIADRFEQCFYFKEAQDGVVVEQFVSAGLDGEAVEALHDIGEAVFLSGGIDTSRSCFTYSVYPACRKARLK